LELKFEKKKKHIYEYSNDYCFHVTHLYVDDDDICMLSMKESKREREQIKNKNIQKQVQEKKRKQLEKKKN
jgi:hypothetical protein